MYQIIIVISLFIVVLILGVVFYLKDHNALAIWKTRRMLDNQIKKKVLDIKSKVLEYPTCYTMSKYKYKGLKELYTRTMQYHNTKQEVYLLVPQRVYKKLITEFKGSFPYIYDLVILNEVHIYEDRRFGVTYTLICKN